MESKEVEVGQAEEQAQPQEEALAMEAEPEAAAELEAEEAPAREAAEPAEEDEQEKEASSLTLEALKPGMRLKGKVRNIVDFGAFIDIGVGRDGLAHISTLKRAGIDKTLRVGDEIDVQIRRVDLENKRISLTIPGAGRGHKTPLRDLEVNAVVKGRIVRLVDFGAFVDIGAQTDGLLHVSQLPWGYVGHPSEVLKVGDEIQVRILDVDPERRRISLTMKGLEEEEEEQPAQDEKARDESLPTAFAVAWEKALAEQRRRQQRSHR